MREDRHDVELLLVEDNPDDLELTLLALRKNHLASKIHVARDGEEALDYLYRRGAYREAARAPRPDLILLDLNMPKMNGREVLEVLKQSPELCRIPVVILTTSQQEADIVSTYDLGCNSYVQKPVDLEQFIDVVRKLGMYWFEVVTLPDGTGQLV